MPMLNDAQRAKVLGLNAARLFKLDVPKHQQLAIS
jgi:predicted TIM-barrel fold metal-dependent hydrolase